MMAVGIPEYRLPRDIIQTEVDTILALGVEIKTNIDLRSGHHFSLSSKSKDSRPFSWLPGLHQSRALNVEGEESPQVLKGWNFLRDTALGQSVPLGKKVVVIGGGNVAIDVALMRQTPGGRGGDPGLSGKARGNAGLGL